jgi:4-hydroxy-4-methyl-2-oxoglutarate aldolase
MEVARETYRPVVTGAERHALHGAEYREIERPSPELIERFRAHDVAKVADAMGGYGIVDPQIKPVAPGMFVVGPAVTVLTRPGDALYVIRAADVAQPGDVIVISGGGCADLAVIGDGISYYMQTARKIAGVVADAGVRDVKGIRELGFPTFSRSVTVRFGGAQGPGAINVPIACGGVPVNPGDIVIGDDDGVVIVPREDAERVIEATDARLVGETRRRQLVDEGAVLTELRDLVPLMEMWSSGFAKYNQPDD